LKQKKSFIIGGAGFIGSHLADVCLEQGCKVWVYDNFSTGRRAHLAQHPALTVIEGDILDPATLGAAIANAEPDTVYHLAAIHHIPTCEKMPEQALRVNIEGTQSVISAAAQRVPRIVFTSTGALYDPSVTGALNENSALKAHDVYSITKTACEHLLRYHTVKNGGQAIAARLFNTVGRRETNAHVIPAIVGQLSSGSRQVRLGNLHPRRDYIHVEDVAAALFAMGNMTMQDPFDCFNVGSGQEHSVLELAQLFEGPVGEPLEIISVPELQRKVDRPSQMADISRLQTACDWKPVRSLRQALREIWEEHLKAKPNTEGEKAN
jgi:UDP-glucose 4-epimerase